MSRRIDKIDVGTMEAGRLVPTRDESATLSTETKTLLPELGVTPKALAPSPPESSTAIIRLDQAHLEKSIALYMAKHSSQTQKVQLYKALMVASWAGLIVGLYLVFNQLIGYRQFSANLEAERNHSIENLELALNIQQRVLQQKTSEFQSLSSTTKEAYDGIQQRTNSVDAAVNKLTERINSLEHQAQHRYELVVPPDRSQQMSLRPDPVSVPPRVPSMLPVPEGPAGRNPLTPPASPPVHTVDTSIPAVRGALVHTNGMGQIDYWIMPSPTLGKFVRLQPFLLLSDGVHVHCLDNGRDYTITMDGEWSE